MIIRELIERVVHGYEEGMPSDDNRLANRRVYSELLSNGQKLLKQRLDAGQQPSDFQYSYIDCIQLQCDVVHECDCLPKSLGTKYWKSVHPLPEIMSSRKGLTINYISTLEGARYSKSSFKQLQYIEKGSRYTSKKPKWFIKNNHLFVKKSDEVKVIAISAVFADPVEAASIQTMCSPNPIVCSPMDLQFNIVDPNQVEDLIRMTLNKLNQLENMRLEDRTNDASNSHPQKAK